MGGSKPSSPVSAGPRRHEFSTRIFSGCRSGRISTSHLTGQLQQTTADVLPGTDQSEKAGDRAHGCRSRHAAPRPRRCEHHGWRRGGIFPCELNDILDRNAGLPRGELGRIGGHPLRQFVVFDGVFVDVVAVDQVLLDDDVHHRERERRVSAGPDRNMPVGQPRSAHSHGSMTTSLAPAFFACSINGQWCELVPSVLQAHRMMYFECTKLSGSTPGVAPIVII